MGKLYHKSFQIIFPCLIFLISIHGISRSSNYNLPEQELKLEFQEIFVELDAFEIYSNFTSNVYSVGLINESDLNRSTTYNIVAGNRKGIWKIDKTSGKLFLIGSNKLNNTEEFQYHILIELKDELSQHIISQKKVTITVQIQNIAEYFDFNGISDIKTEQGFSEEKTFNILLQSTRKYTF